VFADSVGSLPQVIRQTVRDGDVLSTMGAGSIAGVPKQLGALA
jgi:UDP-N-acetylmuramate--alanine ligase